MKSAIFWILFSYVSAAPSASKYAGIATFNEYRIQKYTVCHGTSKGYLDHLPSGTYAAAVGDNSRNIWGLKDKCDGKIDHKNCDAANHTAVGSYVGPSCPHGNCAKCFRVCNEGGWKPENHPSGVGKCIKVQIVDVCPAESAFNYCKTNVPVAERCGSSNNALDIDWPGYKALTGHSWVKGSPNLKVSIEHTSC